jgi:hypothetical protein
MNGGSKGEPRRRGRSVEGVAALASALIGVVAWGWM